MLNSLRKMYRGLQSRRFHVSRIVIGSKSTWDMPCLNYGVAIAPILAMILMGDEHPTVCEKDRIEQNPHNQSNYQLSEKFLTRNFIADAASCIAPSVVNIVAASHGLIPMAQAGTGFIISEDGYIVTNAHVVSSAKLGGTVEVTLHNLHKVTGKVHSMDKQTDIAIIKLETTGENLPVARFGSSSKLRAGEFVVAVGSPLHLQDSVTFGIVSAPARHSSELGMTKHNTDYIQTDAAINVGNSGGPLVNLDGEVIGINCMKAQGYDGISFAIPIDTAVHVIDQLIRSKKVVRPFVGLKMLNFVETDPGESRKGQRGRVLPGLQPESTAVLIVDVVSGSPAELAGLHRGDIIVGIDDKQVRQTKDVLDAIGNDIGKEHSIRILKAGTQRQEETVYLVTAGDRSASQDRLKLSPKRHF